jgi:simple sugar transport system ATP-binding protein
MDIALQHISKHFGAVQANQDISVSFHGGRIIGILGENGAGKSTLMKILSGFQPADSGEILVDGIPLKAGNPLAALAAGIGMLQQDPLDVPSFTIIEDFIYGQPPGRRVNGRAAFTLFRETCQRFGFDLDPDMPVSQLSIGQRQQLEIVRLLALGVKTMILDEPTTGISAEQKSVLFNALTELAHSEGLVILLVSHKLEDVIVLCDEAIVLRAGKLVGQVEMPATTAQLVSLMFGQVLAPQTRSIVPLGEPSLKLENVTLKGKRITIENFTLNIRRGEVVGLAGLDGSGQELLLRSVAGLTRLHHGAVYVNDRVMTGRAYRDFMAAGVIFSAAGRLEEGLVSGLTLTEHTALVGQGAVIQWTAERERTAARIQHFNVRGKPESRIEALSGGNQQRFLMALLPETPTLLSLEQPTRGLDVDSARYIWEQLLSRRSQGTAILFTSPDLDEVVAYSDRIIVCYSGKLFEIADASRVTIDELGRLIGGAFP